MGVMDAAASVLETDPALARMFGSRAFAELGNDPILPVLALPYGPWLPPTRAALGNGALAVVVLDGLLGEGIPPVLAGPGDVLEPWDSQWVAGTPVRLAVIGGRYLEAVSPWPPAAARLLARVGTQRFGGGTGALQERLLTLVWRIAARWGTALGDAVVLPHTVDTRAVAALLHAPEPQVAAAISDLAVRGLDRPDGGAWLLREPDEPDRRDALRARGAMQLALARESNARAIALTEELHAHLARRHRNDRQ
jgi:hypothetical protein